MLGTMMDYPLTINHILWRLDRLFPKKAVVTQRLEEGEPTRSNYGELVARVHRLASALARAGVREGDRVATFAWNTQTHLECYFAVPCMGAVLHTLNIRLFPGQLEYIINHAEDKVVFLDRSLIPAFQPLIGKVPTVQLVVLMNEGPEPSATFREAFPQVVDYEEFLRSGDEHFPWPRIDERQAAAMCYTSGTTGNPKGVVYTHRSTVLHSLVAALCVGPISEADVLMYAVPMFHANAWGMPYAAALTGASQVFTNRYLDAERLVNLIEREGVTISAGVPVIWIPILNLLDRTGRKLPSLRFVICGGSAAPPFLIQGLRRHGIELIHAWGMTETSPLGSAAIPKSYHRDLPEEQYLELRATQGLIVPLVECRIVDLESGQELPWDGKSMGELQVRGPYITGTYYNDPTASEKFMDGWLRTGDVAVIDPEGYIRLVDRTKDLVKSGGEWISSVELENHLMAHPKVQEAAVIGLPHPRWQERPVAAVVPRPEHKDDITPEELREFLAQRVAKWWLPDEIVFVPEVPKTSVGKFDKKVLREQLAHVAQRWAASASG
ncbi:MAG TPA: long-chain fatty acid--CoA ligase [Dehalococcoidia bacterium]|nr:long-chain fatty acid--CoA ligase [Dehalococcoidia bacterium]